jgi:hypothetical protein
LIVTNPEPKFGLEKVSDKRLVGVHLDPVKAGEGDHDSGDASDDGVVVRWHVDVEQLVEGGHRVVLIDAVGRAAIADVVLRACSDVVLPGNERCSKATIYWDLSLETGYDGCHLLDELVVFAEALVTSAPPRVSTHLHTKLSVIDDLSETSIYSKKCRTVKVRWDLGFNLYRLVA